MMWSGVLAVLEKDLRIEWRTKESLASFVVLGDAPPRFVVVSAFMAGTGTAAELPIEFV